MRRTFLIAMSVLVCVVAPSAARATEPADELAKPFVTQKTPPNAPSVHECDATGDPAANVSLDCDDPFPNNEPNIVVDPADPNHMIASCNDYGSCCDQYYTTFDGGQTWSTGNMSTRGPNVDRQRPDHRHRPDARHGRALLAELPRELGHPRGKRRCRRVGLRRRV